MSKKRMFDTRFWQDTWVVDQLNPLDQHLFLYLLLNERTTICGIYEVPLRTIANETGLDKDEVGRMMKRLEPKVFYREGWVVITNHIKHQNYKSPKIVAALQRELCGVPADLVTLINAPKDFDMTFSCPVNTPPKKKDTVSYGIDTVAVNLDLDLTKPNLKTSTNVDEGKALVKRRGNPDINELFDYWETTVGYPIKSKVKNNRNACSTMLKSRSMDEMKRLINGVALAHEDRYAPSIADFFELQANMNRFLAWGNKRQRAASPDRGVKL